MGRSDVGRLGLSRLPSFLQSGFTYSKAFQPLRSRQHLLWRYVGSPTARGAPQGSVAATQDERKRPRRWAGPRAEHGIQNRAAGQGEINPTRHR